MLGSVYKLSAFSALLSHEAAPLNREQKGSSLFVFHSLRPFFHKLRSLNTLAFFLLHPMVLLTNFSITNSERNQKYDKKHK